MAKKVLCIFILFIMVSAVPLVGLAAFAVWLLLTAPVVFGVVFVSGLTFMALKSLAAAAVVFTIAVIAAAVAASKVKKEEIDGVAITPVTPLN